LYSVDTNNYATEKENMKTASRRPVSEIAQWDNYCFCPAQENKPTVMMLIIIIIIIIIIPEYNDNQ
jgi:hypothetical protein